MEEQGIPTIDLGNAEVAYVPGLLGQDRRPFDPVEVGTMIRDAVAGVRVKPKSLLHLINVVTRFQTMLLLDLDHVIMALITP